LTRRLHGHGDDYCLGCQRGADFPSFCADRTTIAYEEIVSGIKNIAVINSDGTGRQVIANTASGQYVACHPAYATNNTAAFTDAGLDISTATKTGIVTNLTNTGVPSESRPDYNPAGTKITYERDSNIWIMDSNGTGQTAVTAGGTDHELDPQGQVVRAL